MMNSALARHCAEGFAARRGRGRCRGGGPRAYRIAFGRAAERIRGAAGAAFLASQRAA